MFVIQRLKPAKLVLPVFLLLALAVHAQKGHTSAAISSCLQSYMQCYPQSQLRDVYKYCFQDYFGPEHIITDSLRAVNYINYEMTHSDSTDWLRPLFVYPVGLDSNYLRVDINYVRMGIVPMGVFVSALLESARPPKAGADGQTYSHDIEVWKLQWQKMLNCLRNIYPQPLNFSADSTLIAQTLQSGKYAVHHSALFNSTYCQHYRIIRRDVFLRLLSIYITNPQSPCSKN